MLPLREPEQVQISAHGITRTYTLSKFPAVAGREIIAGYPLTGLPKIGDYKANEQIMLKLMSYVEYADESGNTFRLTTRELVDNHVPSFEMLVKIEGHMLGYNCSFFGDGRLSNFLKDLGTKLPAWISRILTDSLQRLSPTVKPVSKTSRNITP